jgi:hypothetical protein
MATFSAAPASGIRDIVLGNDLAPRSASPILNTDFLTPIVLLVLLLILPRSKPKAEEPKAAAKVEEPVEPANVPHRGGVGEGAAKLARVAGCWTRA